MVEIAFTLTYFQVYIIIVSFFSFCDYTYDKFQAMKNHKNIQRVPEIRLLFGSFIGGSVGSFLAMIIFRHKIKKASFTIKFFLIFIIQLVCFYLYGMYDIKIFG